MIPPDKFIEMITAGINRLSMANADVQWNAKLGGRQFDVLATVTSGMYKILLAFEVKDKSRSISVDQIEAFVTKAKDASVQKAIFVSTSGYQEGAIRVANKHSIDLFRLDFLEDAGPVLPNLESAFFMKSNDNPREPMVIRDLGETLGNCLEILSLKYTDGSIEVLPTEPSQMSYYVKKSMVEGFGTLDDVVAPYMFAQIPEGTTINQEINLRANVNPPDDYFFSGGFVESIKMRISGQKIRMLGGNTRIEISAFTLPVRYENIITGEKIICNLTDLPLGPRKVEADGFYFLEFPLRYYYCEDVEGETIKWILIESFQLENLLTGRASQDIKYSQYYIPVTDKVTISRLERRRDYYYERERRQTAERGKNG